MDVLIRAVLTAAALAAAAALVPGIQLGPGTLSLPFHVAGFWPAFWGAIIVALAGWLLGVVVGEDQQ